MARGAVIAGASGLIGSSLLEILLGAPEYEQVLLLVRKELPLKHQKLEQLLVDFDKLSEYADEITGDVIFSCLGTTRAQTPDLKAYYKIDHDYALALATIAKQKGIAQFHLVSSMGADADTSNFYTKMKGETEDDLINVGLPATHIYRPSLLTGRQSKRGVMESIFTAIMKAVDPLLFGGLKNYRSIAGSTVALAMYKQSLKTNEGVFIYPSNIIKELA